MLGSPADDSFECFANPQTRARAPGTITIREIHLRVDRFGYIGRKRIADVSRRRRLVANASRRRVGFARGIRSRSTLGLDVVQRAPCGPRARATECRPPRV